MKNQFKPGDLVGSVFGHPHGFCADGLSGDFRGIIVDIDRIVRKEPATYGTSQSYWRITLLITLNRNYNEYFQKDYPVNTITTLTINDLSKWRKIINV